MRKVALALAMTAALAGCTTTERDVGTGAVQVATPSADEVRVEIGRARRRRPT